MPSAALKSACLESSSRLSCPILTPILQRAGACREGARARATHRGEKRTWPRSTRDAGLGGSGEPARASMHGGWVQCWFNGRAAPQLFECRVDLEGVDERHATHLAEFVAAKAAQMANEGEKGECRECVTSGLLARKRIPCTGLRAGLAARTRAK